jgi:hypothetical protein
MVAPIDYSINVQSPFEAALGGFKVGATVAEMQAQREAAQAEAALKKQQQEAAAAAQTELRNLFANPNPTATDFARVSALLPKDMSESVRKSWDMLNADQQSNRLSQAGQVYSALNAGSPEVATKLLSEQATAYRNAGNEREAKAAETYVELIKMNPDSAKTNIGLMISQLPGGDKVISSVSTLQGERRAEEKQPFEVSKARSESIIKEAEAKFAPDKFLADLGLTKAQINSANQAAAASKAAAAKSGAEAQRAAAEANQITAGIIPAEKRPEAETKFRTEYNNQTKGFQEVKSAYSRVLASEDSAVGDLSLIFGYMKMLDPGSVVREGEFATAQNAAGVPERITNIYNKVVSGERLSKSQRDSFKGQAGKLYNSAGEQETTVRQGIERIAKGYGLNTQNIFYTPTEVAPTGGGAVPPAPGGGRGNVNPPAADQRNVTVDY